ncbi:unnamed protein product [Dibothriocephalus latus]|uniref:Uncharacterized protein n=1 Tax=Dibothriocephalus latus TaxID=60516 RepID=A0A3P6P1F7_DIBLA|nr:unnamed protein product [Dibothriocephalus latus]
MLKKTQAPNIRKKSQILMSQIPKTQIPNVTGYSQHGHATANVPDRMDNCSQHSKYF